MSNSLELPFGAPPGKVQIPSQSPEMATTITNSCQSSTSAPSRLGGGNHQEQQAKSAAKHEYQVPLDAITQAIHLDSLPISQR